MTIMTRARGRAAAGRPAVLAPHLLVPLKRNHMGPLKRVSTRWAWGRRWASLRRYTGGVDPGEWVLPSITRRSIMRHKSKLYSSAHGFCGRKAYIGPISPRSHSVLSEKVVW